MNNILIFILLGLLMLLVGFLISRLFYKLKSEQLKNDFENQKNLLSEKLENSLEQINELKSTHQTMVEKLENDFSERLTATEKEREEIRSEKERLNTELAAQRTDNQHLEEKIELHKKEVEALHDKLKIEFENIANQVLDKKTEKFTTLNKTNMESILNPLKERIEGFEKKVDDTEKQSIKRHTELGEQLKYLNEQNQKISDEALNLTRALKGNTKMQGNWGEMILERVLELSGLTKDKEYKTQESHINEENRRIQPDVVVYLPGNKRMIIDSKVSLNAYENFVNSTDENDKQKQLKAHIQSIRNHVDELGSKNYQRIYELESPDFVMLFIPIEAAFAVASNEYPRLYADAFDRKIIIVTPTTLLAVLKTIDSMWQNERQNQNAVEIARQAGRLYDSFVNLIDELDKVGRQLNTVQGTYDSAMKKLTGKGNLVNRVEKLKKLGAKTSKQIDEKRLEEFESEEFSSGEIDFEET